MAHDIIISIINYRTGDLTLGCIGSVLEDLKNADTLKGRIVVVDNASGDGSAEQIEEWISAHPDAPVDLIRSETNSGFSGGHNQGISLHEAAYYLVLNSDAELQLGFLRTIMAAAEAHPEVGLFAPRLEGSDGVVQNSLFRFHSPLSEFIRGAATGPVTALLKHHDVSLELDPVPTEIDWASFACILLRGDMVRTIGPMDEGYFLYFEDAEYCLRAKRSGWRIIYVPKAVAVHFRGGSGPVKAMEAARKRRPRYYYRSRTRFMYQAHGATGPLAANLLWSLGRGISFLRLLSGRKVPRIIAGEGRDIWINLLRPLQTRQQVED